MPATHLYRNGKDLPAIKQGPLWKSLPPELKTPPPKLAGKAEAVEFFIAAAMRRKDPNLQGLRIRLSRIMAELSTNDAKILEIHSQSTQSRIEHGTKMIGQEALNGLALLFQVDSRWLESGSVVNWAPEGSSLSIDLSFALQQEPPNIFIAPEWLRPWIESMPVQKHIESMRRLHALQKDKIKR